VGAGFQYGDWLDPTVSRPDKARTDPGLVATAFRVHSARLAGAALEAAGDHVGAERARALAEQVGRAFRAAYLTPAGRVMSDTPTAYALVLAFDLAPVGRRTVLAERLAALLPHATLTVARTPQDVEAWPEVLRRDVERRG